MNRCRERVVFIIKKVRTFGLSFLADIFLFLMKKIKWKLLALYAGNIAVNKYNLSKDCIKFTDLYEGDLEKDIRKIKCNERKILFYNTDECIKDIKYGWEEGREQYLPLLAAGDGNICEILAHIQMLTESDNFFYNKNAMEVSIHTINVLVSVRQADKQLLYENKIAGKHLRKCLTYILRNPEFGIKYSANHYFFDLLGILWLINSLQYKKEFRRLEGYILRELKKLMGRMIAEDGSLYEGSTYYHRYVTESFLLFLYFNREMRNKELMGYAKKMYDFCTSASIGDLMYGFGDNDSGRLLALPSYFEYSGRDIRLIHILCKLLNMEKKEKEPCYYAPYFGLVCLQREKISISFRCDEIKDRIKNKWIGVHCHNDQLSVEIAFDGVLFFVNAGTFLYIEDDGNRLNNLRTDRNNTAVIEGLEQNTVVNSWQYCERTYAARLSKHGKDHAAALFRYENGYIHRRALTICDNNRLVVKDEITREGGSLNRKTYVRFFVSGGTKIERNENGLLLTKRDARVCLQADVPVKFSDCVISPEYGMRISSYMIELAMPEHKSTVALSLI